MSAVMTMAEQRLYSVDVELTDGTRKVLQVQGESPGEAYRQARQTADVRRVGRVSEGFRSQHSAAGSPPAPVAAPPRRDEARRDDVRPGGASRHAQQAPEPSASPAHRGQLLGLQISGPRLVRDARPAGGERPFANLPRPARADPVAPPPRKIKRAQAEAMAAAAAAAEAARAAEQAAKAAQQAVQAPAEASAEAGAEDRSYRIVKSRRKDGSPYLLQRGNWVQQGAKRVFEANWEKGFDVREQAERHLTWLEQHESETAEVTQHA